MHQSLGNLEKKEVFATNTNTRTHHVMWLYNFLHEDIMYSLM